MPRTIPDQRPNMPLATVLIPTHDHGPTLRYSVGSVLDQTIQDIEIFLVGDGISEEGRNVATQLASNDRRVRFFDNHKGLRHGEAHRHAALGHAAGRIVCYLADDDLWLPEHVEEMCSLLADADFSASLRLIVHSDDRIEAEHNDLELPLQREGLLGGRVNIPLSCVAHTLVKYRELTIGWHPAPDAVPTGLHMWTKFLVDPSCRVSVGKCPTSLNFPTVDRIGVPPSERAVELSRWAPRTSDPGWRTKIDRCAIVSALDEASRYQLAHNEAQTYARDLEAQVARLQAAVSRNRLKERVVGLVGLLRRAGYFALRRLRQWLTGRWTSRVRQ